MNPLQNIPFISKRAFCNTVWFYSILVLLAIAILVVAAASEQNLAFTEVRIIAHQN